VRHRLGRGAAPAAGPGAGRRPAAQPVADPVHHAGDLPVLRPPEPALHRAQRGGSRRGRRPVMNLSAPFIVRPVATLLISLAILLVGALSFGLLPVSPLPNMDFPAITVQA